MNLRTKECINAINYQYHMYACTLHVRVRVRVRVPRCTFVLPGTVQLHVQYNMTTLNKIL